MMSTLKLAFKSLFLGAVARFLAGEALPLPFFVSSYYYYLIIGMIIYVDAGKGGFILIYIYVLFRAPPPEAVDVAVRV